MSKSKYNVTARNVKRRSPEEITELARKHLMREVLVTADEHVIKSAFYIMVFMMTLSPAAIDKIGAFIGDMGQTVPRMGANGYPVFLSCAFLHKADVPAYDAEVDRMLAAMGTPRRAAG